MRKIVATILTLFLILTIAGIAQAAPRVIHNGQTLAFDVPPTIENGRTLVPLRAIFESLGAEVKWDGATKQLPPPKLVIKLS